MKTTAFIGMKFGLTYCPKCKVVYYNKPECDCDLLPEEKDFLNKNFPEENKGVKDEK